MAARLRMDSEQSPFGQPKVGFNGVSILSSKSVQRKNQQLGIYLLDYLAGKWLLIPLIFSYK